MDNALYLKNVMKTLSGKPAQLGLRRLAGNKVRTNIAHAAFGIASEGGELIQAVGPYLLGQQMTPEMKLAAFDEMGDIGYFMRVLAKYLKVKLPAATKKTKLNGMTRGAAVLHLAVHAQQIGSVAKKSFYGPVMGSDGKIDVKATEEKEAGYRKRMADNLTALVEVYWALCYDMLGTTPSAVFKANIDKLAVRYPEGTFSMEKEASKNPAAEAKAVAGA